MPRAARGDMPRRGDVESSATLGAAAAAGWAYLAEGGAHLVLERRDVADDDPNVAGARLRLRKTKTEPSSFGEDVARDGARDDALEPRSNALTDASLWASHPGFENARSAEDRSCAFAQQREAPSSPGDRWRWTRARSPLRLVPHPVADAVEPAQPRATRALSRIDPAATRAALAPDARRVDRVRRRGGRTKSAAARAGVVRRGDWRGDVKPKCGFAGRQRKVEVRFAGNVQLRVRSRGAPRERSPRWTCSLCDDSRNL